MRARHCKSSTNERVPRCLIRTQDDSTYVRGQAIRRVVYWQDSNGSTFVLSPLGGESLNKHPLVVEDCTVIYARAKVGWLVVISQPLTLCPPVAPLVRRLCVQHERRGSGQWGIHRHLQEHPGGGSQAHTAALQDPHAGSASHQT